MKTQQRQEVRVLLTHLPRYVQHLQKHPYSLLSRFLGTGPGTVGWPDRRGAGMRELGEWGRFPRWRDLGLYGRGSLQGGLEANGVFWEESRGTDS